MNLFADFFKFFKCRLFNNNSRKSAKIFVNNENQNNEIIETNNWTRLLIFDDKINFYFLNMFLYMTSVVNCRTFLHFMSSIFNNLKKTNSENISTPKEEVLNIAFALKLRIYRSLKSLICLKWIRKKPSITLHTQFNYLT